MKSALVPKNKVTVRVYDLEGNLKREIVNKNITCTEGRADIIQRLIDFNTTGTNYKGVVRYMGIGTGNTAAAVGDTSLVAETNRSPIIPEETVVESSITAKFYASFGSGIAVTIREAGLFTGNGAGVALNSGELLARSVFGTPIDKSTDEVIVLEWSVSLNNG